MGIDPQTELLLSLSNKKQGNCQLKHITDGALARPGLDEDNIAFRFGTVKESHKAAGFKV